MSAPQVLTGWHSGKWPGGTFGLRFGKLRETLIEGRPASITLKLDGEPPFEASLKPAFWRDCPEVRSPHIRRWVKTQKIALPWTLGDPPRFAVEIVGKNSFRIRKWRSNQNHHEY